MIALINGPFGVGKTTTAKLVVERPPNAMLYDPEVIGFILQRLLRPIGKVGDFQDYALWRTLVVEVARLLKVVCGRTLVVPMTVWRRDYFGSIAAGLGRVDTDLACFRLTASEDVLAHRVLLDLEDREARAWRMSHVEVCLAASRDPSFGEEIATDGRMSEQVADEVLARLASVVG